MERPCLYFGEEKEEPGREPRYAFYHELDRAGGPARFAIDLNGERLAGYLEGAAAGRWDRIVLRNGIPRRYAECFEGRDPQPLSSNALQKLLDGTNLLTHYPNLLDERE